MEDEEDFKDPNERKNQRSSIKREKEAFLLSLVGRFEIKTGCHHKYSAQISFPRNSALFQLKDKLYCCGGERGYLRRLKEFTGQFFSLDYSEQITDLAAMQQPRSSVSLSGFGGRMIGVGGWNEGALATCEKYSVASNKWEEVGRLKTPREWPGSVVLPNLRAFCFCGFSLSTGYLNSIERAELKCGGDWELLSLIG